MLSNMRVLGSSSTLLLTVAALSSTLLFSAHSFPLWENPPNPGLSSSPIKKLVVFGDSYSDPGNVYALSSGDWPAPHELFTAHRFSNGLAWADYLTGDRRLKTKNLAFGGATTDNNLVQGRSGRFYELQVPGFLQQIDLFQESSFFNEPEMDPFGLQHTLVVVSFQGNDLFFDPEVDTLDILKNIEVGVKRLQKLGMRHLLILTNTDMGKMPWFLVHQEQSQKYHDLSVKWHQEYLDFVHRLQAEVGTFVGPGYRTWSTNTNSTVASTIAEDQEQEQKLKRLGKGFHDQEHQEFLENRKMTVDYFDLFRFHRNLMESPERLLKLGISNTTAGCLDDQYEVYCDNPEAYFFVDAFHPTTAVHRHLADALLDFF